MLPHLGLITGFKDGWQLLVLELAQLDFGGMCDWDSLMVYAVPSA